MGNSNRRNSSCRGYIRGEMVVAGLLAVITCLPPCQRTNAEEIDSAKLTPDMLQTSLKLGTQFLLNNQKPAGNFEYLYDWKRQQYSPRDGQVRQAGAVWGLATIQGYKASREVEAALQKALDFMNQRSRRSRDGWRFVVYPNEKLGKTGTVALVALAHLDYLRSCKETDAACQKYRPFLESYIQFLSRARRDDGSWHGYYDLLTGKPLGASSPYADGESLLALVKAAKYLGYEHLKGDILVSARAGYQRNVVEALELDPDSPTTKGYYQWSSMAFFELATSDWEDADVFGDHVIELADWMIDVHQTLKRTRNTAYAYEGIIHAYQLAKLRQDQVHMEKFGRVIDAGIQKLSSWQLGNPIANQYVLQANANDLRSHGGIQNHRSEPLLRIDVAQHQMHAVTLALEYYFADPVAGER